MDSPEDEEERYVAGRYTCHDDGGGGGGEAGTNWWPFTPSSTARLERRGVGSSRLQLRLQACILAVCMYVRYLRGGCPGKNELQGRRQDRLR